MTVAQDNTYERFVVSGSGPYAFSWRIFNASDLAVTVISGTTIVPLTLDTHYSVSDVDDEDGGSISFLGSYATTYAGYTLDIRSNTPVDQLTNIRNTPRFLPEVIEGAFDYLSRQNQDARRLHSLSPQLPDNEIAPDWATMLSLSSRKGKYGFFFNATTGAPELAAGIATVALTAGNIGLALYPRTSAEVSAGVTPTDYSYPPGDVRRYGAVGDNVTDDSVAIRNAISVLDQAGGGDLIFGAGLTYLMATVGTSTYSVRIPVANGTTFETGTESHQYLMLFANLENIRIIGNGAIIRTTVNNAGEMIIMDGCRDIEWIDIEIRSPHSHNSSGTNLVTGMNGWGVTSQTRDSWGIKWRNCRANGIYTAIYQFGDEAGSYRIRSSEIEGFRHENGFYTVALHNNGDGCFARGVQSYDTLREFFCYGADGFDVEMYSDTGVGAFTSLIKAYTRDTTNGRYKLKTKRNTTSVPAVHCHVEHNPSYQATPFKHKNITIEVDNRGVTGTGVGVDFSYLQTGSLQSSSSVNLWDGIVLKGIFEQAPVVNSTQNGATAAWGSLNTDEVVLLNGSLTTIWNNKGFRDNKTIYQTFTPTLRINGSTTGITYTTQTGEYWREGRFIRVAYRIVLSNKGGTAGAVTLDLPVPSAVSGFGSINGMVWGEGQANMAGLSGPLCGFVGTNGGTTLTLRVQGATGVASLADTNLTNTSDIRVWAHYPIA